MPEGAALAGILRNRRPGDEIETMAILTTEASPFMKPLHDRMPAIVGEDDYHDWLDCREVELVPYAEDVLEAYRVSSSVNSPRIDGPVCIDPLDGGG